MIATAFDATSVRHLALYPPYRAATRILNAAYFPENTASFNPERPDDLLPKSGEYPTERVQYSTPARDAYKSICSAIEAGDLSAPISAYSMHAYIATSPRVDAWLPFLSERAFQSLVSVTTSMTPNSPKRRG